MEPRSQGSLEPLLEHARRARALARRLALDAHRADDLVQGAWVAALERPPAAAVPPRRWLAAVLRNLARRARRSELRRAEREAAVARPESVTGGDTPERIELARRLLAAVEGLPEPYRSTVWARWFDELPPRAIAARHGVPVKTVKTRLARGLVLLRERLERDRGDAWIAGVLPFALPQARAGSWTWGIALVKTKVVLLLAVVLAVPVVWIGWRSLEAADGQDGGEALAPRATVPAPGRVPGGSRAATRSRAATEPTTARTTTAEDPKAIAGTGEEPPGVSRAELERVLDSFYGDAPRIDELQAFVPQLAAEAVVEEGSVHVDPETGIVEARIGLSHLGLAGKVEIDGDAFRVELREGSAAAEWRLRSFSVAFELGAGRIAKGQIGVQHHLDPAALPPSLGTEERPVGWILSTTTAEGTRASPIVARRGPDGRELVVGHPRTNALAPIEQPDDWDLRGFEPWRTLVEPLRQ